MSLSECEAPSDVSSRYAWYVVGVLLLTNVLSYVDRTIISLLIPDIKRDLGVTDTQVSLLVGLVFAVFYSVAGLPIGRLADSRNRRNLIAIGIVVWSAMTALSGLAKSYWHLFVARVGVGLGEATLSPSAYSIIADYFKPERLSLALSVFGIGSAAGSGLALIIGGLVVETTSNIDRVTLPLLGDVYGWGLVFFLVGVPGLLVALLLRTTVEEPARRDIGISSSLTGSPGRENVPIREFLAYLRQNRKTLACLLIGFPMHAISGYGLLSWLPTFFQRTYGWSPGDAGILYGTLNLTLGSLGAVTAGWLADQLRRRGHADSRFRMGAYTALTILPAGVLFPVVGNEKLCVVILGVYACASSFSLGLGPAAVQELMPNRMRGQASAVYLLVMSFLGLTLGPTGVALLTDYVFADEAALRYSMAIVVGVAMPISALLLWAGRPAYVDTLASKEAWIRSRAS